MSKENIRKEDERPKVDKVALDKAIKEKKKQTEQQTVIRK